MPIPIPLLVRRDCHVVCTVALCCFAVIAESIRGLVRALKVNGCEYRVCSGFVSFGNAVFIYVGIPNPFCVDGSARYFAFSDTWSYCLPGSTARSECRSDCAWFALDELQKASREEMKCLLNGCATCPADGSRLGWYWKLENRLRYSEGPGFG